MAITTPYIQARDGNLYIGSSRVTLDSIIVPWKAGQTPETIHLDYPSLPLSDIYGAIAHYLEHQAELDSWLREGEEMYERQRAAQQAADPAFYQRMRERLASTRQQLGLDTGDGPPDPVSRGSKLPRGHRARPTPATAHDGDCSREGGRTPA